VDFSLGTFYAVSGIHACADPEGGALAWLEPLGTPALDVVGGLAKDKAGYMYLSTTAQDTANASLSAAYLSKLDIDGTTVWKTMLSGTQSVPHTAHAVAVDGYGGIYMGICVPDISATLVKYNDCGTEAWRLALGPCSANTKVSLAAAEDFVLVAWKAVNGTSWLQRFARNGTILMNRNLLLNPNDEPTSIAAYMSNTTWQGGYVAGRVTATLNSQPSIGGVSDIFILRFNTTGAALWTRVVGTSKEDDVRGVVADKAGSAYVAGTVGRDTTSTPAAMTFLSSSTAGGTDAVLLKYLPTGSLSWYKMLATASDDVAQAVDLDDRGNVYVAGYTNGSLDSEWFLGKNDLFVTKYSPGGARHWTRMARIQTVQTGVGLSAAGTGVHVAGSTYSQVAGQPPAGFADVFMAKYETTASCVGLSEGMDYVCPGK
jgi:hypothetical protein